jgi:hypothetical protein
VAEVVEPVHLLVQRLLLPEQVVVVKAVILHQEQPVLVRLVATAALAWEYLLPQKEPAVGAVEAAPP